jgi:hypothetical protein
VGKDQNVKKMGKKSKKLLKLLDFFDLRAKANDRIILPNRAISELHE